MFIGRGAGKLPHTPVQYRFPIPASSFRNESANAFACRHAELLIAVAMLSAYVGTLAGVVRHVGAGRAAVVALAGSAALLVLVAFIVRLVVGRRR